jgi:hypothetical protein
MIRKLGFSLVLVTAFMVVACGRQVTPNPPGLGAGGASPGYMVVKFDVAAPFDFSTYQYWVVFNTSGNGKTPLTNPQQTNWAAYSDAIEVAGIGGAAFAQPVQFVKNNNPVIPPTFYRLLTSPTQFQYVANSNGSGTEFTVTFQRAIFQSIASPSPAPSPTSSPLYARNWTFNAFVTQANTQNQLIFEDSMGQGGATDTSYSDSPPLPSICSNFDTVYYKQQDINPPSDPAAQIVSVEIANNGSSPPPCQPVVTIP